MEDIEIIELNENSEEIKEFYLIYKELFPKKEESENLENILKYLSLKKTEFYGKNNYHILILKLKFNKNIIGLLIGDYYYDSGISFIEFIGVVNEYRSKGFAKLLFNKFIEISRNDADRVKSNLNGILIEVERPEAIDAPGSFTFWDHLDFKKVECKYIQPSLSPDKQNETNLMLMYLGLDEKNLKRETLLSAIKDYFKYAMSKENPTELEEFKMIEESVSSDYVILTRLGSTWFVHPTIHYFFTMDITDMLSKQIDLNEKLNKNLLKNIVSIGTLNIKNETIDDVYYRLESDKIDFSQNYLEKRYIMRGNIDYKFQDFIYYAPYESMIPFNTIPANLELLFSYNSIGVVVLELIIHLKTTLSTGTLISVVNFKNIYISNKQIKNFLLEILEKLGFKNIKNALNINPYPLIFVSEYGGKFSDMEVYGITEIDSSYWEISNVELRQHSKNNISIVKNIQVFYEFLASLVAAKNKEMYIDNIEEIAGIQIGQISVKGDLDQIALSIVEAEYSVEIERLRIQYTLLYNLYNLLENKNITKRYSMEYRQLLDIQKKLVRKMDEISLIDTERFPSLKRIFKNAQERLGISELKTKIEEIQNNIKEEIQVRSNVLNILIFSLILIQIFEPYLPKEYNYIIYTIVIIAAATLLYSFLIKK